MICAVSEKMSLLQKYDVKVIMCRSLEDDFIKTHQKPVQRVTAVFHVQSYIWICTDLFNGQFTDVFSKNEHTQVPLLDRSAPFMNDIAVSKDGVIKLLKGLNPSKALGPDELHPRVLKELATELGPVFAHLFQQSIDTGEIPKEWSLANICPLFKKSDRSLACNYRPAGLGKYWKLNRSSRWRHYLTNFHRKKNWYLSRKLMTINEVLWINPDFRTMVVRYCVWWPEFLVSNILRCSATHVKANTRLERVRR